MLNKVKNIIVLFVLILTIGLLTYIYYRIKNISNFQNQQPPSVSKTIKISDSYKGKLKIIFNVDENKIDLPTTLPQLTFNTTPLTEAEAVNYAKKLGFNRVPKKLNDVYKGIVYTWSDPNNFLMITASSRKLKYGPAYNPKSEISRTASLKIDESQLENTAKDFLISKIGLSNSDVELDRVIYLKTQTNTESFVTAANKDNYELVQFNFKPKATNYPILTTNPLNSIIYVQVLKNNTVLNSEITLGFPLNSTQEYNIKNYDDIKSSIEKAVLVSLNDSSVNLPDLNSNAVQEVDITDIQTAYLLDQSNILTPVFLLTGNAKVSGFNNPVNAMLYLPAY